MTKITEPYNLGTHNYANSNERECRGRLIIHYHISLHQ